MNDSPMGCQSLLTHEHRARSTIPSSPPYYCHLETPERIAELDTLYRMFCEQVSDLDALRGFCRRAVLPSDDPDEYSAYFQTDHGIYLFRFNLCKGDYNLYLEAFDPAVAQ